VVDLVRVVQQAKQREIHPRSMARLVPTLSANARGRIALQLKSPAHLTNLSGRRVLHIHFQIYPHAALRISLPQFLDSELPILILTTVHIRVVYQTPSNKS